MRAPPTIAALTLVAATAFPARGAGPVDVEIAALAGYGTNPAPYQPYPNPLGFGLGGRVGLAFSRVYLGARVETYLGGSARFAACGFCGTGAFTQALHETQVGTEGGYDFRFGPLLLRPELGMGLYLESGDGTSANFFLQPGGAALLHFGAFFVGADAGVLVIPAYSPFTDGDVSSTKLVASFTFDGQLGVRF